ncbi:hypothetical protein ACFLUU_09755 [Chloroflexota bacterium]
MPQIFDRLGGKKSKDIRVLGSFISIFCRENSCHPYGIASGAAGS